MVRNDSYFYLSGLLSFLMFGAVVALFVFGLFSNDSLRRFALKQANYVSVSLTLPDTPTLRKTRKSVPSKKPSPQRTPKPAADPKSAPMPVKDISSLFSEVKTQKIEYKKNIAKPKPVDQKRLSAIEKRIKTSKKNEVASTSEDVKRLAGMSEQRTQSDSTAPDVDRYMAEVHTLVYSMFYPPQSTEGSSAKVRLWIDANRKLTDFRVLVYSGNPIFDREVDDLKKRLKSAIFPKHPTNQSQVIDIILKAEG